VRGGTSIILTGPLRGHMLVMSLRWASGSFCRGVGSGGGIGCGGHGVLSCSLGRCSRSSFSRSLVCCTSGPLGGFGPVGGLGVGVPGHDLGVDFSGAGEDDDLYPCAVNGGVLPVASSGLAALAEVG